MSGQQREGVSEEAVEVVVDFLGSWRFCPVSQASVPSRSCLEDAAKQLLAALPQRQRESCERTVSAACKRDDHGHCPFWVGGTRCSCFCHGTGKEPQPDSEDRRCGGSGRIVVEQEPGMDTKEAEFEPCPGCVDCQPDSEGSQ